MDRTSPAAFTLVELLVVITIIVVLLALLMPALDKAIYQAELAVCGTNLHGIGLGIGNYAMNHRRQYPYRRGARENGTWEPGFIASGAFEERTPLQGFVALDMLQCPLTQKVDLSVDVATNGTKAIDRGTGFFSAVASSYNLWYGWQYRTGGTPAKGMFRVGDRFEWQGDSFNLLASDIDRPNFAGRVLGSHPDADGVMRKIVSQDSNENPWNVQAGGTSVTQNRHTWSVWFSDQTYQRGLIEMNFAFTDNSVERLNSVKVQGDARMTSVPPTAETSGTWPGVQVNVMRR